MGVLVSKVYFDKVCSYLGEGEVIFGGKFYDGVFVEVMMVEIFGND